MMFLSLEMALPTATGWMMRVGLEDDEVGGWKEKKVSHSDLGKI